MGKIIKRESKTKYIERNNPPRVHISYDVETDGGIERKELPNKMLVMADLTGDRSPKKHIKRLEDRRAIEITKDNFDEVMDRLEPRIEMPVLNKLANDGSKIHVELTFDNRKAFEPDEVAKQVPALRRLIQKRQHLMDALTRLDGNLIAKNLLFDSLSSSERLESTCNELGIQLPTPPSEFKHERQKKI